ncbi:MAG: Rap1a/Tai family immunity protein [Methylobacterium frigidaeris]
MPRFLAAAALAVVLVPHPAAAIDGGLLVAQCKSLLRGAKVTGKQVDFRQEPDTVACWAFMGAVQDLAAVAESGDAPPLLRTCLPADGTLIQLVQTVVKYGNAHPAAQRESAGVLALLALREAYPCGKP